MSFDPLVINLVQGRVQQRFVELSKSLRNFVEVEAPTIERVHLYLEDFYKQSLGKVNPKQAAELFTRDKEEAMKSQVHYNRLFGTIDHHFAMMTSNFGLPQFLNEENIPVEQIPFIQNEIRVYWNSTYGNLIDKFSSIKKKLKQLIKHIDIQVNILKKVHHVSYFDGLEETQTLITNFRAEREIFWQIVNESRITRAQYNEVKKWHSAAQKKLKVMLIADMKHFKEKTFQGYRKFQDLPTKTQKAIVVLAFLNGSLAVYLDLRKNMIKKFISNPIKRFIDSRTEQNIALVKKQMVESSTTLTAQTLNDLVGVL